MAPRFVRQAALGKSSQVSWVVYLTLWVVTSLFHLWQTSMVNAYGVP